MFESRHFKIETLADGVFAAIHRPGGWAIGNAGIVDLGDFTLVYDTFITIEAGQELREAAETLTGNPVKIVVNSHYHNDHVWGNQVFDPETLIVSSADTRQLLTTKGKEEYEWYLANSAHEFEDLRTQYDAESDEKGKERIAVWMSYYEGLVATMPRLAVRLAEMTFQERLEFHGAGRRAELIAFSDGHTPNDTVLYMPSEGILFMSDLLFVDSHPFLADGNPDNLLFTLEKIATMEALVLVPGHGPPGTKQDLALLAEYIGHCRKTAVGLLESELGEDAIKTQTIPERFRSWEYEIFYPANLRYYFHLLAPKET